MEIKETVERTECKDLEQKKTVKVAPVDSTSTLMERYFGKDRMQYFRKHGNATQVDSTSIRIGIQVTVGGTGRWKPNQLDGRKYKPANLKARPMETSIQSSINVTNEKEKKFREQNMLINVKQRRERAAEEMTKAISKHACMRRHR